MNLNATEQILMDVMAEMEIIDCHEHLPPEEDRTGTPQDVFTLFSHYTRHDLFSAGLDRAAADLEPFSPERPEYQELFNYDVPILERWDAFEPYWQRIRHGSYARAAILTAKMVYGIDHIGRDTCEELSQRIAAENTPGIYRRMLCDRCGITASLTQGQEEGCELPMAPVVRVMDLVGPSSPELIEQLGAPFGLRVACLDDYRELMRRCMDRVVEIGGVGIKCVAVHTAPPDAAAAEKQLKELLAGQALDSDRGSFRPLSNFLLHEVIELAAERKLPVAVHAGIWGDFRAIDCKHLLTLAPAHPRADFDLYHLGMPSVRDAIVIAKNLPNVYLNLCWTHIISQVQACSGIDELLDQVPVNKVLAFGGDYERPVEKVVGHLQMAREDFARVFGARIDRGLMDMDDARELLRLWFRDNPLALYARLGERVRLPRKDP